MCRRAASWVGRVAAVDELLKLQHVWRAHVEATQADCKAKGAAIQQNHIMAKLLNWDWLMTALISATLKWPCY